MMKTFLACWAMLSIGFGFGIIYADERDIWVYQRVFVAAGFFLLLFAALIPSEETK